MFNKEKLGSKGGTKPQVHLLPMMAMLVFGMIALVGVVSANYSFNGSALEKTTSGSCNGDVWVSAGDHSGLRDSNWAYQTQTYVTNYTLPSFDDHIKWAHLYIGAWGGTSARKGYANTTLTESGSPIFSSSAYLATDSDDQNVNGVGAGTWLVDYDVTDIFGDDDLYSEATITATIDTTNAPGFTFDGRIYGATLVIVYEDSSSSSIQYQINDGLLNLNNQYQLNTNNSVFSDVSYNATEANVTIVQIAGDKNQPDYVYFNPPNEANSPYQAIYWDISSYTEYQLGNSDVADNSSSIPTNGTYFDIDYWTTANDTTPLRNIINQSGDNVIVFKRGLDSNNNGTVDAGYYDNPKEGEAYLSPIVAIVKLTTPN